MRERKDQSKSYRSFFTYDILFFSLPPFPPSPLHSFFVDIYSNPSFRSIFNRSLFHRSYRWKSISGLQLQTHRFCCSNDKATWKQRESLRTSFTTLTRIFASTRDNFIRSERVVEYSAMKSKSFYVSHDRDYHLTFLINNLF